MSISEDGIRAAARSSRLAAARVVRAAQRTAPGGGQALPRRRGQLAVLGHPELGPVATGPLEVVAEDLFQLDEVGAALLEPGGEALVQIRPHGLR